MLRLPSTCRRLSRRGPALLLVAVLAIGSMVSGQRAIADEGYAFSIPDVDAVPGGACKVAFQGAHVESIQGFSLGVRFPAGRLSIDRIHFDDTILDAIGTDYFEVFIDPESGFFTIGCLVDAEPPFEGQLIPSVGRPIDFFYIEGVVSSEASEDIAIEMDEGLHGPAAPPVENVFVVDDLPVASELARGAIRLPFEEVALFIRGDVTIDTSIDVSDAISILDFLFRGGPQPGCFDSADVNDDRVVDMSDSIFLLGYLFVGGAAPPPPSREMGADPTVDPLGCEEPIDHRRVLVGG